MRLLWIAPQAFYSARGTPMNVRRLAEAIAGAGHSIDLVTYGFGDDVPLPPSVRVVRAGRLPFVTRVPIGPSLVKILLDVRVFFQAARLLRSRKARYDLIQGFEEGAWIAAALSRLFALPFVYDMDSEIETQLHESRLLHWLAPLARRIDRSAVRDSIAVLTVCGTLTARVRRLAPEKPVFQIEDAPNVIEFGDRQAARREVDRRWQLPGGPLIVYTGNLEPYQGVDLLVRAAAAVSGERSDAVFLIVGGNGAQVSRLRELAGALGAGDRVVLLGERPEAEMPMFLAAADVLVSPRSLGTNTPMKLYAYLMSGRPVVATDRPVHTQVLSAAEAVLACPTPEGLARAILEVLRDPERGAAIAQNAVRLVATTYSPAAFAGKARAFAAAIESLVAERK
ncbi:MAG TPA: glycosyltransferase family 4 protein [Candidatus Binatia bacterium]|nr:glycosyltransferase family 4 protein [Candidatus Binatia bacterium]